MTALREIQRACFHIYKNQNNCETFVYTKIQTLCKKQDNIRYVLIYENAHTLCYSISH